MNKSNHEETTNFVDHSTTSGLSETGKALMNKLKTEIKYYKTVKSLKGSDGKGVVVDLLRVERHPNRSSLIIS